LLSAAQKLHREVITQTVCAAFEKASIMWVSSFTPQLKENTTVTSTGTAKFISRIQKLEFNPLQISLSNFHFHFQIADADV
jgi:hypothetical protein